MASGAWADSYRRLVNFEWEPIQGATRYDLEITEINAGNKIFRFKVKESAWNGDLAPGAFSMRIRALDYRGVPGDWSPPSPFDVGLDRVKITFPTLHSKVTVNETDKTTIDLKWDPVPSASEYLVELNSSDGSIHKSEKVTGEHLKVEVPVAMHFTWKILATRTEVIKSEAVTESDFDVVGGAITAPVVAKQENDFVREVKWNRPDKTKTYDVSVQRYNKSANKWEKTALYKDFNSETLNFDPAWSGGLYKVSVKAKGELRVSSANGSDTFQVRGGDRSPASEFNHEVRKSIDRVNGWYGIASYLITMVDFKSSNWDALHPSGTSYSAIGGTGRLGAGWFKEDKDWGFLAIVDMSGFINNQGNNVTSKSTEVSAVWRAQVGDRGEFRSQMGVYYKEHPVLLGDVVTGTLNYDTVSVAGPHLSGEYWYSMTPKLGLQVNAHMYYGMLGLKTPNGQAIIPSVSNQVGVLGSYRLSKRMTGLMGVARRDDNVTYNSQPASPLFQGQRNTADLSGTYLNLFAEYNF